MYHAQGVARPTPPSILAKRISSAGRHIAEWLTTAADYYSAAVVYERLSKLSDAELQRRGFSRTTLAADICQACKHASAELASQPSARSAEGSPHVT